MKPFRIYEYDCGGLRKFDARLGGKQFVKHDYDLLNELEQDLQAFFDAGGYKHQLVIVEYTAPYRSKILKVIN
jgi:hypothetical protein